MNIFKVGGVAAITIFIISVASLGIILEKLHLLFKERNKFSDRKKEIENCVGNKKEYIENKIKFLELLYFDKMWIVDFSYTISPILGILGTVFGLMKTFATLTDKNSSIDDLAVGISQALITTALGLIVAIVFRFLSSFIKNEFNKMLDRLEIDLSSLIENGEDKLNKGSKL